MKVPAREDALLRRLEEALSDTELRRVLAGALLESNAAARGRLVARLGSETGAVLARTLKPPRIKTGGRRARPGPVAAGKARIRQEWDLHWKKWDAVVLEAGQDDGKYVEQEAHWEPPYLDLTGVATDLETVASRMRPLISRVVTEQIDPEFRFTEALEALDAELSAPPDGVEPGGESCGLGPEATGGLLEYEWALAQHAQRGAAAFCDEIRDLEKRLEQVALDGPTVKKFVLGLSEADRRAVLASLTRQRSSARWADAFKRAHGGWAEILRALSRRYDPKLHAETSRANIGKDWTLALPLIRRAVRRKAHDEAAILVGEAVRSLIPCDKTPAWNPRGELLVQHERWLHDGEMGKLLALLDLWQETAQAQGQEDLAAALAVQIVALRDAENGDVVLRAFRALPPRHRAVADALFTDWRDMVVERTLEPPPGHPPRAADGGWLRALIDAARSGPPGAAAFQAAVRATLANVPTGDHLHDLAVLTLDLGAAPALKKRAPRLSRLLNASVRRWRDGRRLEATRRSWCARLGGASLLPDVLAFWQEKVTRFVPDPADMTADYTPCTEWLAAAFEINAAAASKLVARWAEKHRLKRNLWRGVAERGLPTPGAVQMSTVRHARGEGRRRRATRWS